VGGGKRAAVCELPAGEGAGLYLGETEEEKELKADLMAERSRRGGKRSSGQHPYAQGKGGGRQWALPGRGKKNWEELT